MLQNGPLLFASTIFILAGIQLVCLGLVSELLARTYYESQGKPIYVMRSIESQDLEADDGAGRYPQVVRMNSNLTERRRLSARNQPLAS